ncbi:MAG: hypothetical protein K8H88_23115 [Sandaracinaceae bacterium]|nr:hypothetical protein [Sandaracinaceae bacterium]
MSDWTLRELRVLTAAHLDSLYERPMHERPGALEPVTGRYRGHFLRWIDNAGARKPLWRLSEGLGFGVLPFGIDFDRRLWFFFDRRVAMGRFDLRAERSRWRDTQAFCLHYEVSRLPALVRGVLYDEVKPLSQGWLLGIGGVNAERGLGDHFYFALRRVR